MSINATTALAETSSSSQTPPDTQETGKSLVAGVTHGLFDEARGQRRRFQNFSSVHASPYSETSSTRRSSSAYSEDYERGEDSAGDARGKRGTATPLALAAAAEAAAAAAAPPPPPPPPPRQQQQRSSFETRVAAAPTTPPSEQLTTASGSILPVSTPLPSVVNASMNDFFASPHPAAAPANPSPAYANGSIWRPTLQVRYVELSSDQQEQRRARELERHLHTYLYHKEVKLLAVCLRRWYTSMFVKATTADRVVPLARRAPEHIPFSDSLAPAQASTQISVTSAAATPAARSQQRQPPLQQASNGAGAKTTSSGSPPAANTGVGRGSSGTHPRTSSPSSPPAAVMSGPTPLFTSQIKSYTHVHLAPDGRLSSVRARSESDTHNGSAGDASSSESEGQELEVMHTDVRWVMKPSGRSVPSSSCSSLSSSSSSSIGADQYATLQRIRAKLKAAYKKKLAERAMTNNTGTQDERRKREAARPHPTRAVFSLSHKPALGASTTAEDSHHRCGSGSHMNAREEGTASARKRHPPFLSSGQQRSSGADGGTPTGPLPSDPPLTPHALQEEGQYTEDFTASDSSASSDDVNDAAVMGDSDRAHLPPAALRSTLMPDSPSLGALGTNKQEARQEEEEGDDGSSRNVNGASLQSPNHSRCRHRRSAARLGTPLQGLPAVAASCSPSSSPSSPHHTRTSHHHHYHPPSSHPSSSCLLSKEPKSLRQSASAWERAVDPYAAATPPGEVDSAANLVSPSRFGVGVPKMPWSRSSDEPAIKMQEEEEEVCGSEGSVLREAEAPEVNCLSSTTTAAEAQVSVLAPQPSHNKSQPQSPRSLGASVLGPEGPFAGEGEVDSVAHVAVGPPLRAVEGEKVESAERCGGAPRTTSGEEDNSAMSQPWKDKEMKGNVLVILSAKDDPSRAPASSATCPVQPDALDNVTAVSSKAPSSSTSLRRSRGVSASDIEELVTHLSHNARQGVRFAFSAASAQTAAVSATGAHLTQSNLSASAKNAAAAASSLLGSRQASQQSPPPLHNQQQALQEQHSASSRSLTSRSLLSYSQGAPSHQSYPSSVPARASVQELQLSQPEPQQGAFSATPCLRSHMQQPHQTSDNCQGYEERCGVAPQVDESSSAPSIEELLSTVVGIAATRCSADLRHAGHNTTLQPTEMDEHHDDDDDDVNDHRNQHQHPHHRSPSMLQKLRLPKTHLALQVMRARSASTGTGGPSAPLPSFLFPLPGHNYNATGLPCVSFPFATHNERGHPSRAEDGVDAGLWPAAGDNTALQHPYAVRDGDLHSSGRYGRRAVDAGCGVLYGRTVRGGHGAAYCSFGSLQRNGGAKHGVSNWDCFSSLPQSERYDVSPLGELAGHLARLLADEGQAQQSGCPRDVHEAQPRLTSAEEQSMSGRGFPGVASDAVGQAQRKGREVGNTTQKPQTADGAETCPENGAEYASSAASHLLNAKQLLEDAGNSSRSRDTTPEDEAAAVDSSAGTCASPAKQRSDCDRAVLAEELSRPPLPSPSDDKANTTPQAPEGSSLSPATKEMALAEESAAEATSTRGPCVTENHGDGTTRASSCEQSVMDFAGGATDVSQRANTAVDANARDTRGGGVAAVEETSQPASASSPALFPLARSSVDASSSSAAAAVPATLSDAATEFKPSAGGVSNVPNTLKPTAAAICPHPNGEGASGADNVAASQPATVESPSSQQSRSTTLHGDPEQWDQQPAPLAKDGAVPASLHSTGASAPTNANDTHGASPGPAEEVQRLDGVVDSVAQAALTGRSSNPSLTGENAGAALGEGSEGVGHAHESAQELGLPSVNVPMLSRHGERAVTRNLPRPARSKQLSDVRRQAELARAPTAADASLLSDPHEKGSPQFSQIGQNNTPAPQPGGPQREREQASEDAAQVSTGARTPASSVLPCEGESVASVPDSMMWGSTAAASWQRHSQPARTPLPPPSSEMVFFRGGAVRPFQRRRRPSRTPRLYDAEAASTSASSSAPAREEEEPYVSISGERHHGVAAAAVPTAFLKRDYSSAATLHRGLLGVMPTKHPYCYSDLPHNAAGVERRVVQDGGTPAVSRTSSSSSSRTSAVGRPHHTTADSVNSKQHQSIPLHATMPTSSATSSASSAPSAAAAIAPADRLEASQEDQRASLLHISLTKDDALDEATLDACLYATQQESRGDGGHRTRHSTSHHRHSSRLSHTEHGRVVPPSVATQLAAEGRAKVSGGSDGGAERARWSEGERPLTIEGASTRSTGGGRKDSGHKSRQHRRSAHSRHPHASLSSNKLAFSAESQPSRHHLHGSRRGPHRRHHHDHHHWGRRHRHPQMTPLSDGVGEQRGNRGGSGVASESAHGRKRSRRRGGDALVVQGLMKGGKSVTPDGGRLDQRDSQSMKQECSLAGTADRLPSPDDVPASPRAVRATSSRPSLSASQNGRGEKGGEETSETPSASALHRSAALADVEVSLKGLVCEASATVVPYESGACLHSRVHHHRRGHGRPQHRRDRRSSSLVSDSTFPFSSSSSSSLSASGEGSSSSSSSHSTYPTRVSVALIKQRAAQESPEACHTENTTAAGEGGEEGDESQGTSTSTTLPSEKKQNLIAQLDKALHSQKLTPPAAPHPGDQHGTQSSLPESRPPPPSGTVVNPLASDQLALGVAETGRAPGSKGGTDQSDEHHVDARGGDFTALQRTSRPFLSNADENARHTEQCDRGDDAVQPHRTHRRHASPAKGGPLIMTHAHGPRRAAVARGTDGAHEGWHLAPATQELLLPTPTGGWPGLADGEAGEGWRGSFPRQAPAKAKRDKWPQPPERHATAGCPQQDARLHRGGSVEAGADRSLPRSHAVPDVTTEAQPGDIFYKDDEGVFHRIRDDAELSRILAAAAAPSNSSSAGVRHCGPPLYVVHHPLRDSSSPGRCRSRSPTSRVLPRRVWTVTDPKNPLGCGRLNPYCATCRSKYNLIFVNTDMRPLRWPSPQAAELEQMGDCRFHSGYVFGGTDDDVARTAAVAEQRDRALASRAWPARPHVCPAQLLVQEADDVDRPLRQLTPPPRGRFIPVSYEVHDAEVPLRLPAWITHDGGIPGGAGPPPSPPLARATSAARRQDPLLTRQPSRRPAPSRYVEELHRIYATTSSSSFSSLTPSDTVRHRPQGPTSSLPLSIPLTTEPHHSTASVTPNVRAKHQQCEGEGAHRAQLVQRNANAAVDEVASRRREERRIKKALKQLLWDELPQQRGSPGWVRYLRALSKELRQQQLL